MICSPVSCSLQQWVNPLGSHMPHPECLLPFFTCTFFTRILRLCETQKLTSDNDEPEFDSTFRLENFRHPQNTPTMPLLGVPGLHSHTFGEIGPSGFLVNYYTALVLFPFFMDTSFKESLPLHCKTIIYHLDLAQTRVMHSKSCGLVCMQWILQKANSISLFTVDALFGSA